MPTNTDIAPIRRKADAREHHGPPLRSTSGTRTEHLQWAAFLIVRILTGFLRAVGATVAWFADLSANTGTSYTTDRPRRRSTRGAIRADLVIRYLRGKFANRQPDLRSGFSYWALWIGCTARGHLTLRDNMLWTPDPASGDPEVHAFEVNRAGDATTIHLRNIWRSAYIVKSRYGTAWFALPLSKKQLAFRVVLALATAAFFFT